MRFSFYEVSLKQMFSFWNGVESIHINDEDKDDLEIQFSKRKKKRRKIVFLKKFTDREDVFVAINRRFSRYLLFPPFVKIPAQPD